MIQKELTAAQQRAYNEYLDTCNRIRAGKSVPKESPGKKKSRIEHLLNIENSFDFIDYYYSSDKFQPSELSWFLKEFEHNFWVKKERKHVLEIHREGGKSIIVTIKTPMQMLAKGELTGMILASENEDKAQDLIKDLEAQLRNNKRFIADFGNQGITGSWLQSSFRTKSGIGFWAFGLGQNPAGVKSMFTRPNLGIVDDADNYKKSKNPNWLKENKEWVNGEFMGCLAKDDRRFVLCNNRVHKEGLTAHVVGDLKEGDLPDEGIAHVKAYLTEDPKTHLPIYPEGRGYDQILKSLKDQGAVPAWKEYYSLEDCAAKIVDYGVNSALRQLYHKHMAVGDIFDDDNMPWRDTLPLSSYNAVVDYCDPAFGESGKGSHKCIVRVGKIGHRYDIIKVWLRRLGQWWNIQYDWAEEVRMGVLISENESVGLRDKPKKFQSWVECNSLQRSELRKTYKIANLNRKVAWIPKYDDEHKGDKISRIEGLEPIFNEDIVGFNIDEQKNPDMIELRDQFKGFPTGAIDGPDAFQGAKKKLDLMHRGGSSNSRTGKYKRDTTNQG